MTFYFFQVTDARYFFFILFFISKVIPNIHPMLSLITFHITKLRLLYHILKCRNPVLFQQELRSNSWDADCRVCVYCIIYSNARILYHFNKNYAVILGTQTAESASIVSYIQLR